MRDPEVLLGDILVYSRRAIAYLKGVSRDEFVRNTGIQDQVIRCLEVVGEAARRMPEDARSLHPAIPWPQMAGLRNRLAHEYDAVDMGAVWVTATRDLPAIVQSIRPAEHNPGKSPR